MIRFPYIPALALITAAVLVAGCGDDGGRGDRVEVVASTGVVADLAAAVAGEDAVITQLIPDSASPHAFTLSARDRARLEDAALVVLAGGDLEAGIPVDDLRAPTWRLLEAIPRPLPAAEGDGLDPHTWLDPARVRASIPSLAGALAAADPANAAAYRRRAAGLQRRLRRLDRELESAFASLSDPERVIVSSHDSLAYLADRYGLELIGGPFGATGPEGEVSAAKLQDVIDAVAAGGAVAVYAQATDSAELLERVAAATGTEVRTGLLVESPGPAGDYLEMMRRNAELMAGG